MTESLFLTQTELAKRCGISPRTLERDAEYLTYHLQGERWLADKTIDAAIKADMQMIQPKRI